MARGSRNTNFMIDRKRRSHKRNCNSKQRFSNKSKAVQSAYAISEKVGHRLNAYKCLKCKKYHIGEPYSKINKANRALDSIQS